MEKTSDVFRWMGKFLIICVVSGFMNGASALVTRSVSNGYSGCSWRDNGDSTSTIRVTISFKGYDLVQNPPTEEQIGYFVSRGIILYKYDKNGVPTGLAADDLLYGVMGVRIGDRPAYNIDLGGDYALYWDRDGNGRGNWGNWRIPLEADVNFTIGNTRSKDWSAISVRAGEVRYNTVNGRDDYQSVGEIRGVAYITRDGNGSCPVINPENPPPQSIKINMTAPDWNLGELPEGNGEKVFSSSADQLCFTYQNFEVANKQFVINASSANGIVGNRYRLKNATDVSQFVPYTLQLDGGSNTASLPNASNSALPLNDSGRTCFVPTFKTTVAPRLKDGDYSDVLTFTVVTKS